MGIIGANGAGKTTFINMVTGYLKPDDGIILFRGVDITRMPPRGRPASASGVRSRWRSFSPTCRCATTCSLRSSAREAAAAGRAAAHAGAARAGQRHFARLEIAAAADRLPELPQGSASCSTSRSRWSAGPTLLLDELTSGISAEEKFPLMDLGDGSGRRTTRGGALRRA